MDIVEFLTARLNERAELAQRVADRYVIPQDAYIVEEHPERAAQSFWPTPVAAAAIRRHPDAGIRAGLDLIEMYSPTYVLAELAAQRAIIEDYQIVTANAAIERANGNEANAGAYELAAKSLRMALVRLAAPYAEHEDYAEAVGPPQIPGGAEQV